MENVRRHNQNLNDVQKKYESLLQENPCLQVLWTEYAKEVGESQSHASFSVVRSILKRAVDALPNSPQLRIAHLVSLSRSPHSSPSSSACGSDSGVDTEHDIFEALREALEQAGDHPGALPLWQLSLQLLRTPSLCAHHLPRLLAAYCCLLSLPAPPDWRAPVQLQVAKLTSSLCVQEGQLCSSLAGVPSCPLNHPFLAAMLAADPSCITCLAPAALSSQHQQKGDAPPPDVAAMMWQRREYFETYLAAYLEQDTAYQASLRAASGGDALLSVRGCYRVVSSGELDLWHAYLDFESAALMSAPASSLHPPGTPPPKQAEEHQLWQRASSGLDVPSCRRGLARLFRRALAPETCMLYPEMWRKYAMWLLQGGGGGEEEGGGVAGALQLLRGALAHEPMSRSQALRVLLADLLEYSGHIAAAREVLLQLVLSPSAQGSGGEPVMTVDLEVLSLVVGFECRQRQPCAASALLDQALLSARAHGVGQRRLRNALLLLRAQVQLAQQQAKDGEEQGVGAVQERLAGLCGTGIERSRAPPASSPLDLDLAAVFAHEDDLPLVKGVFDLLLQLPRSALRDAQVWRLLSCSLTTAVYGVTGSPPPGSDVQEEEGEVREPATSSSRAGTTPSPASTAEPVCAIPGVACPALVLLLRQYARGVHAASSIGFSLQAEVLVDSCSSRLRQQRLHQQSS